MMKNKKAIFATMAGALGVFTYVLKEDRYRNKVSSTLHRVRETLFNKNAQEDIDRVIKKAGHPMPHDIEDNKMVSEGAMTSVNYYNEKAQ